MGLIIVALVAVGAWFLFGSDAPAKPSLGNTPIESGGPATPNGTWTVTRGTDVYVGYRMTEVFRGDIIHTSAVGRTPTVDGSMMVMSNKVTSAQITGDMRDLKSNRTPRDNYIHTHAIESDTFPTATFMLTEPITLPGPLVKGKAVKVSATGDLMLHGVAHRVTVPLEARWTGPTINVVGTAPIKLADYKIEPPKTSVVKTDDHGSFEISLTFSPA